MAATLKELIRQGEGLQVEFKKTLPHLEKIAKTLVAFANTKGGVLLVGIQDDKFVCGISDVEEELFILEKANQFYCQPKVSFRTVEEEVFGKKVLMIEVFEGIDKPYRAQLANGDWQVFVRAGDQCVLASSLVIKVLETQRNEMLALMPEKITNNERALFSFLERQRRISLKDYAKLINVSKRRAYRILIELTLKGKLFMHDFESNLFFTKAS